MSLCAPPLAARRPANDDMRPAGALLAEEPGESDRLDVHLDWPHADVGQGAKQVRRRDDPGLQSRKMTHVSHSMSASAGQKPVP